MKRVLLLLALLAPVYGDEGMWLFNQFPKDQVKTKYGVELSQAMLNHLRLSSVRVGASGSFVSPNGLIFTNHHVVLGCVQDVSTPQNDYVANGFYAKSQADEKQCPGAEANVLLDIKDVTSAVKGAVKADPNSPEGNRQRKAEMTRLETDCGSKTGNNCQVVTLYGGAQYDLYEYKKYTDVRLVFAPEFQIGFFGGDPDNFTYPRYCLDIGFFRVYENGRPAKTTNYLKWSKEGVEKGEAVFVSGNPGRTERLLTMAEAEYYRDATYPFTLKRMESAIAAVKTYMSQGAENERAAKDTLFGLENSYKAMKGRYSGLQDAKLMAEKRQDEQKLREAVKSDPAKNREYGQVWDEVSKAIAEARTTYLRRTLLDGGPLGSQLFGIARGVLRLPEELAKPADKRLKEYAGSALASMQLRLFAPAPITESLEAAVLTDYFAALESQLGANDAVVKSVLRGRTAAEAAKAYVAGTELCEVSERKRLSASVNAAKGSKDTMLELVRVLEPEARRLRKEFEDGPEAALNAAKPKLGEARFAVYGAGEPPDATFTLRLSYGQVKGFEDNRGKEIPYATTIGGAYQRATGELPYVLPPSWLKAKDSLNLNLPFDFVSTSDIIGGNSGSPTVNEKGEIVGIVFDMNIEALPNHFEYAETQGRCVHVASQAIVEALRKVYRADRVLGEIGE
jgi:hypothetical protein